MPSVSSGAVFAADWRLLEAALAEVPSWLIPQSTLEDPAVATVVGSSFVVICVAFLVGHAADNVSQIDKLWSILPAFQACWFAYNSQLDARCTLMAGLATAWSIRLTFNFWMKGGYSFPKFWLGEEGACGWNCGVVAGVNVCAGTLVAQTIAGRSSARTFPACETRHCGHSSICSPSVCCRWL